MATELGKLLRKIIVDNDEYLKDMANHLGITSSYLSAIENGKRKMSPDYLERISDIYKLTKIQFEQLQKANSLEQRKVEIDIQTTSPEKKYAALAFARDFDKLSEEQLERIRKIIEGDDFA